MIRLLLFLSIPLFASSQTFCSFWVNALHDIAEWEEMKIRLSEQYEGEQLKKALEVPSMAIKRIQRRIQMGVYEPHSNQ